MQRTETYPLYQRYIDECSGTSLSPGTYGTYTLAQGGAAAFVDTDGVKLTVSCLRNMQWCYFSILIEFVPMLQIQFPHNMGPTSFQTPMYSIHGYGGVFGPPSPMMPYGGVFGLPSPEAPLYTGYGGPPQVQIVFGKGFGVDAGTRDKLGMYNEEMVNAREEDAKIRAASFQTDVFASSMPMQPTLYNPPPMSP